MSSDATEGSRLERDRQIRALTAGTRYARNRLLWTWAALALLAIMTCAALLLADRAADQSAENTETIALAADETADQAAESNEMVVSYLRGEQGIPGVPGENGVDGTAGLPSSEPGLPGEPGARGEPGPTGPTGPTGAFGPIGATGPAGTDGVSGTDGIDGEDASQTGPQGPQGAKGDRGPEGPTGPAGAAGPAGPAGAAAPPLQPPRTVTAAGASVRDDSARKTANATCPNGFVSGGGFAIDPSDPGLIVTASAPVGTNGWSVTVERLSLPTGTQWQVLAFATCVT